MKYNIVASQNGWEYEGHYTIVCKEGIKQINRETIVIDKTVIIEFDEEVIVEND